MSGAGLRNWRGEIVQPKGDDQEASNDTAKGGGRSASAVGDASGGSLSLSVDGGAPVTEMDRRPVKVVRKDEFGRDVEVTRSRKLKREREGGEKKERKHKKHKHRHGGRRDEEEESPQGHLAGTPPPPDPFRPQLDEKRYGHGRSQCRSRSRDRQSHHGRSASRRRSRSRSVPRSRSPGHRRHHRRSSDRGRSRSRGRDRSRSRSSTSRSHRRHLSTSLERKWTHNAFDDRSPSPPRQTDPLYRPEPESWVSRAGGVYLPRK